MMISTAADALASASSSHIRIMTAILDNRMDRAHSLLLDRMRGVLQGFAEGDIIEDDSLVDACATLCSSHGPLVLNAMTESAHRECIRIAHA